MVPFRREAGEKLSTFFDPPPRKNKFTWHQPSIVAPHNTPFFPSLRLSAHPPHLSIQLLIQIPETLLHTPFRVHKHKNTVPSQLVIPPYSLLKTHALGTARVTSLSSVRGFLSRRSWKGCYPQVSGIFQFKCTLDCSHLQSPHGLRLLNSIQSATRP